MTTENARQRGRPRLFDVDEAVALAQEMFHARGYDNVSVQDVTTALGIRPPSFYAAFGSKMGLYQRVLERYGNTGAIPLAQLLRADRPVAECLLAVLEEAARRYAADRGVAGCLVLEDTRCRDDGARAAACGLRQDAERMIHDYIAARHPAQAQGLTDFMSMTMAGLSAKARAGESAERLLAMARLSGLAIGQALGVRPRRPAGG